MAPAERRKVPLASLEQTGSDKVQLLPRKKLSPGKRQNPIDTRRKKKKKKTLYHFLSLN